jgi:predicted enzyme related to lactoylglutathione lyase
VSQADVLARASELWALIERCDAESAWALVAPAARTDAGLDALRRMPDSLDEHHGAPRRLVDASPLPGEPESKGVRLVVDGPKQALALIVRFDDAGHVVALGVIPGAPVADGIRNIVIGCPVDAVHEVASFYAELLDLSLVREDWPVVGKSLAEFPRLAFGDGWSDDRPARWPDPGYPAQIHLDVFVRDVAAVGQRAVGLGATAVRDDGDHATFVDPVGHPFCLMLPPPADVGAADRRLGRLVLDCDDPEQMAVFYAELLGLEARAESTAERIVLKTPGTTPSLVFQHVSSYVPPRWHDPSYPAQVHLDLHFNDPAAARTAAERLGAVALPPPRGSCDVYADPAGHPFCLCSPQGIEHVLYIPVIPSP